VKLGLNPRSKGTDTIGQVEVLQEVLESVVENKQVQEQSVEELIHSEMRKLKASTVEFDFSRHPVPLAEWAG
jgi:hypothetical protein